MKSNYRYHIKIEDEYGQIIFDRKSNSAKHLIRLYKKKRLTALQEACIVNFTSEKVWRTLHQTLRKPRGMNKQPKRA